MTLCIAACSGGKGKAGSEVEASPHAATTSSPNAGPPGKDFSEVLPVMYRERCIQKNGKAAECQFLRLLLSVEVTMALDKMQRSKDQRDAKQALAALARDDDPNIIVAATRVLGSFPDTPGIADKALPMLLENPWLTVRAAAAQLLRALPDQSLAAIGAVWQDNHKDLYPKFSYDEYPDFPAHYAIMKFPDYPDAEWFSPLDSDRSVGWWTTDEINTVTRWLSAELKVQPLECQQRARRVAAPSTAAFQAIDQSKQARVQKLAGESARTQNAALLQEMQKLQEELYAPVEAAGALSERGVDRILPLLLTNDVVDLARFYIAEGKAGHIARMILVYRLPDRGRTVIQEAWNLGDYASAWPTRARPQGSAQRVRRCASPLQPPNSSSDRGQVIAGPAIIENEAGKFIRLSDARWTMTAGGYIIALSADRKFNPPTLRQPVRAACLGRPHFRQAPNSACT